MQKDIAEYISTCECCQRINTTKLQNVNEELHNIPIPMKPMAQVGIDLMKLKPSKGYKYVITAIDYFMKHVEMGALKDKTALSVVMWILNNIFCHYGVTDIHITNNSTEFVKQISKELYSRCNIAHCITSPYHPTANGLMERLNRMTTEMMIKGLDQQEDWPNFVQTCAWNIQSNVHKSTNYQPIHLLIGRRCNMPPECINYSTNKKDRADFTDEEVKMVMDGVSDENLKCLIGLQKDILHPNAHLNIKKSSARQKKNYDLRNAMPMKLSVGDLVLKIKQKNLKRKGGRLENRTEEKLFCVQSIMSNGNLQLRGEKSKEMYPHFVPLNQMKSFLLKKRSCPTSPKYVETNVKVQKSASNSTISMSSPSASGSPSTS